MLKIISRPPFDNFSIKLFFSLFAKRKQFKLDSATFLYLWTGPLSLDTGLYVDDSMILKSSFIDMDVFFKQPTTGLKISGDKKFFADTEQLFADYLTFIADKKFTDESNNIDLMRIEFYRLLEMYSANTYNRKEMEKLIDQTISNSTSDTVVLFIKDHHRMNVDRSWIDMTPELSIYFSNMCDFYNNKHFIIVSSLENLDKEIVKDNCTVINMGGDITNQMELYKEFTPNVHKNLDTSKNFISLNRGARHHRVYLVASLYARGLDDYGNISMLSIPENFSLSNLIKYDYHQDVNYNNTNKGITKYHSTKVIGDSYDIYLTANNDNLSNFKNSLQNKYLNSYIEFVSETSYNEYSFNITEKTLHFIYGCNYPILISSPGTVKFLREMGIDMFDDIIDHSYDDTLDPADRINKAIDDNLKILTMDTIELHHRWLSDKYRMEKNISFVKNNLLEFYQDRFWKQLEGTK